MARICQQDEPESGPDEDTLAWMEAAELLSLEVDHVLEYLQAYSAFVRTVHDDELGEAGEWEGDPTEPETIDVVASWLLAGHLEELLPASSLGEDPESSEELDEDQQ